MAVVCVLVLACLMVLFKMLLFRFGVCFIGAVCGLLFSITGCYSVGLVMTLLWFSLFCACVAAVSLFQLGGFGFVTWLCGWWFGLRLLYGVCDFVVVEWLCDCLDCFGFGFDWLLWFGLVLACWFVVIVVCCGLGMCCCLTFLCLLVLYNFRVW